MIAVHDAWQRDGVLYNSFRELFYRFICIVLNKMQESNLSIWWIVSELSSTDEEHEGGSSYVRESVSQMLIRLQLTIEQL
jgi:hypothetical protein